jgi:hypothetical protein
VGTGAKVQIQAYLSPIVQNRKLLAIALWRWRSEFRNGAVFGNVDLASNAS